MTKSLNDSLTIILFQFAETYCIPHFDDDLSKKMLKNYHPLNVNDLCIIYTLNRTIVNKKRIKLFSNKRNPEKITYLHPLLKKNLSSTFGIIVFEEQLMDIIQNLSNLSIGISETIRTYMGTKNINYLLFYYKEFYEGCLANLDFINGCKEVNEEPKIMIKKIWDFLEYESVFLLRYSYVLRNVLDSYIEAYEVVRGKELNLLNKT